MAEIQTTGSSLGSTLTGVSNLAQLFLGNSQTTAGTQAVTDNRTQTTTTSGGTNTTTTSTSVPPGAVDAVIKAVLEGTNGLAAVSGGQRTAGLYGSSTNQLLSNDLVARAAAEAAKLNQTTTQTAVTGPTTSTTALSGGTTTATNQTTTKNPAINPRVAMGALGLLQAIPKGVKDSVLEGLLGGKAKVPGTSGTAAASEGSGSSQQAIADAYSDPSRALDVAQGSNVGADGVASVGGVAGTNAPQIDGISIGGGDVDVGGLSDTDGIANFLSTNDNFAGVDSGVDYLNELGSGVGDVLGGLADSVSSAASGAIDWVSDAFNDFSFNWADGGHISQESRDKQLADHVSKKVEEFYSKKSVPGYADGGGIGAAGDTRYGNTRGATDAKVKREIPRGNLFEETRTRNEQNAGLRSTGSETMQEGSVPRTAVEPMSITSIIDNLPILVRAVIGNMQADSASRGKGVSGNVPGFANGGSVSRDRDVYDLDTRNVGYLANTGLRSGNLKTVNTGFADSNDQAISKMLTEQLRGREANGRDPNVYNPGTSVRGANPRGGVAGANSTVSQSDREDGGPSAVGAGVATGETGLNGVSGLSAAQSNAAAAAAAATGIPGLSGLVGLATNPNPANAFASMAVSAAATAAGGPIAGLVASALMSMMNSHSNSSNASGPGNTDNANIGTASATVGQGFDDDGNVNSDQAVTTSESYDANTGLAVGTSSAGGNGGNSGGTGSAGGPGSGSDGGPGDSGVGGDSAGDGSSGSAGTSAGGDNWRHGGEISGPGTGVSDSILAKVSDGEYIIPADVVEALGVPFFDKLRDKYHTPAAEQREEKAEGSRHNAREEAKERK